MTFYFSQHKKIYMTMLCLVAILVFLISCKTNPDNISVVDSIKAIYESADKEVAYSLDSAIVLLDSGINKSINIKHDSLIIAGMFLKANCVANQGNRNYADSVYKELIYGNKYFIDSLSLNKIKLRYAHLNYLMGNQTTSLELCNEVIPFFERNNSINDLIQSNINISKVYTRQNDFSKAMDALMKALALAEKSDNKNKMALIYGSMGNMYFRENEYDKSLDCFKKSLEYHTLLNNVENIAVCYQSMGTISIQQEEYKNAEEYLEQAGKMFSDAGNSKYIHVLNSLGVLYKRKGDYDRAIETYNKIVELNEEINNSYFNLSVYNNISQIYYDQGKFDKAEYYLEKSYVATIDAGETDFREYYENMMRLNEGKGNWKGAYKWARKFHTHSDSIFNIQKYKETENLRSKYETEKKDLQLEKMKVEKEKDKATILKNRIQLSSISALLMLTFLFGVVYYRQNQLKIQSYKDLVKKNEELINANTQKRQQVLTGEISKPAIPNGTSSDKINISEELVYSIKQKLNELINKKFYTNPELTLNETARELDTNTSYLSQIINDGFDSNFPTFINQLRVEEAQKLLKDSAFDKLTIEGIGKHSGFKSKSAFNTAFKKLTGVTPSFYKNNSK